MFDDNHKFDEELLSFVERILRACVRGQFEPYLF